MSFNSKHIYCLGLLLSIGFLQAGEDYDKQRLERLAQESQQFFQKVRNTQLCEAVVRNNVNDAQFWLEAGANPDMSVRLGQALIAPLCATLAHQNPAMIHLLIEKKADPNQRFSTAKYTALQAACLFRNHRGALLLLSHGACVNSTDRGTGATPLMYSLTPIPHPLAPTQIVLPQPDLVRSLLLASADPSIRNNKGAGTSDCLQVYKNLLPKLVLEEQRKKSAADIAHTEKLLTHEFTDEERAEHSRMLLEMGPTNRNVCGNVSMQLQAREYGIKTKKKYEVSTAENNLERKDRADEKS